MDVETLVNENKHYVPITLQKLYGNVERYAKTVKLEADDIHQFGLIGLWVGCKSYLEGKHETSLKSHLIRNIKWTALREVQKQKSKFQYYKSRNTEGNKVTVLSLNAKVKNNDPENETTFEDITSVDNIFHFESVNPEKKVLSKFEKESILNSLKPADLEFVRLRMEGLTFQQIADIHGTTRQNINAKFLRMQKKLARYIGVV